MRQLAAWDRHRRAPPDALRRELAQRRRSRAAATTAAMPTCCRVRSTSIASPSVPAAATTSSSSRGCSATSRSNARSTPARAPACRCTSSAPDRTRRTLRTIARGTRTTFHGYLDDAAVNALVGDARAAILPGEEDFGLVPLEAAAAGTPTIALRARRRARNDRRGRDRHVFRSIPTTRCSPAAVAIAAFDRARFDPQRCARTRKRSRRRGSSPSCARSSRRLGLPDRQQRHVHQIEERVRDHRGGQRTGAIVHVREHDAGARERQERGQRTVRDAEDQCRS